MIVLDASVVADFVLDRPPHAETIRRRIQREATALAAPHLVDVEVASALRRNVRWGRVTEERARAALALLVALPIQRHPHGPHLARAFDLRHHATAYDATYLALAEALGAPLLTRDAALARVPGHRAAVEVVA